VRCVDEDGEKATPCGAGFLAAWGTFVGLYEGMWETRRQRARIRLRRSTSRHMHILKIQCSVIFLSPSSLACLIERREELRASSLTSMVAHSNPPESFRLEKTTVEANDLFINPTDV